MALVQRIQNICLKPQQEWDVIAGETTPIADLLKSYALPLAAIGAVAGFIGMSIVGFGLFRLPLATGLIAAVVGLALSLAMVYALGLIIDALAPQFGAPKDRSQALKVAIYSFTPGWVAGVVGIVPSLRIIPFVAMCYGIYLLHLGLLQLMKAPKEKAAVYTVVVVLCGIGLAIVKNEITGAIVAPAMLATMPALR